MKANKILSIYMVGFTSLTGLISVFALFNYVFVPAIPFFYLLLFPFYFFQFVLFSIYRQTVFAFRLYIINIVICCFLFLGIKTLVGTQFFAFYQLVLVLGNCLNYHKILSTVCGVGASLIVRIACIAVSTNASIMIIAATVCLSTLLTISSIFQAYPPIQMENNMIKFGVSYESEFTDSDFFMVDGSIDICCGKLIKIGAFYSDYA